MSTKTLAILGTLAIPALAIAQMTPAPTPPADSTTMGNTMAAENPAPSPDAMSNSTTADGTTTPTDSTSNTTDTASKKKKKKVGEAQPY